MLQGFDRFEQAVGEGLIELMLKPAQQFVILFCPVGHAGELDGLRLGNNVIHGFSP
jgi:hypothetical protein